MAKTFAVTTTATDTLKTDAKGHAEAVFTVTNTTARPVRGMARAKALESTKQDWLQITGETERDFAPGSTQQFVVTFDSPIANSPAPGSATAGGSTAAAAADQYSFRLDISSATNPDEDFTEGPVVKVQLPTPATPPAPSKPFPKWILIPIAVVVLIGIGLGLFFALRKTNVAVPDVVGMTLDDAKAALESAKLTPVEKEVQITGKVPVGQVIDQDPKSDSAPVPKNSEVQLTSEGETPLVEVPDVTKRLIGDARDRLKEKGLAFVETSTEVTPGLQPDQVVSQKPNGGEKVKPGDTVALVVAAQKQIVVPDVTFKPANAAQAAITAAGLSFVMKAPELAPANVAAGNIKSQNPAGGVKVPAGAVVELVAAAASTQVPNVIGKKIAEAKIALQQAGLDLGSVSGLVNEANAAMVTIKGQSPGWPATVARGSKVDVSVPQPCPIFQRCFVQIMDPIEINRVTRIRQ